MNKYVLVTAMILFAAISNTDAQNNQVKDFKMVEEGGSGPWRLSGQRENFPSLSSGTGDASIRRLASRNS